MLYELTDGVEIVYSTENDNIDHFFGYYEKSPFDASGRKLLSHGVARGTSRMPGANDTADLYIHDLQEATCRLFATTQAFNYQQGAMLQWLGPDYSSRVIYNDYRDGRYVSVLRTIGNGDKRGLPLPIYSLTSNGKYAACVNYDRLFWCRPGYCYACGGDEAFNCNVHSDDGISLMDLDTGQHKLLVRTSDVMQYRHLSSMDYGHNYIEHVLFSPVNTHIFFLHRWRTIDHDYYTRAYVVDTSGANLRLLSDSGDVSHYNWVDDSSVILYGSLNPGLNKLRRSQTLVKLLLSPLRPLFKLIVRPGSALERSLLPYCYPDLSKWRFNAQVECSKHSIQPALTHELGFAPPAGILQENPKIFFA
jgi:hypothetical protein